MHRGLVLLFYCIFVTKITNRIHAQEKYDELTYKNVLKYQGHPTDCFGKISVRKTCNRLKFSVREMSSRAF